jgi:hypothetical protein
MFYYLSTVTLKMREEDFWKCTPRKLFALLDIHLEANMTEEQLAENGKKRRNDGGKNNKEVIGSIASW